jgi:hypothetical protein
MNKQSNETMTALWAARFRSVDNKNEKRKLIKKLREFIELTRGWNQLFKPAKTIQDQEDLKALLLEQERRINNSPLYVEVFCGGEHAAGGGCGRKLSRRKVTRHLWETQIFGTVRESAPHTKVVEQACPSCNIGHMASVGI